MVKRTIPLAAGLITFSVFLFFVGFILGQFSAEYQNTLPYLEASELATESAALEQLLIQQYDNTTCPYLLERQNALARQLGDVGRTLSQPTIREDLTDDAYDTLKRRYHLMQIQSFIWQTQLASRCAEAQTTILFYYDDPLDEEEYAQDPAYYDLSVEQGEMLDAVVQRVGEENISVYAIELNYAPELLFLQRFYNITMAPTVLIDQQYLLEGLSNTDTILAYVARGNTWNMS
jgi:hypothetical protein